MKKTLIALAAVAATSAFAQSTVQLDGIMDTGYQSVNYKGNKVNGIIGNGSSTSQLNIRGTEDLGGGLKAVFRVETDWGTAANRTNTGAGTAGQTDNSVATGSTFGNGEIRAGLMGGFGAVHLGAVNYNSLTTYVTGQPFGTAIGSGFRTFYVNDAQATSSVRADNAIMYVSPSFSGLTGTLYKSNKQTKAAGSTAASTSFSTALGAYDQQGTTEFGLNFANGPLAASFSTLKNDFNGVGTGTTTQTVNTLGANYAMGDAKLMGLYQTNKTNTNSVNNKAMSISATYTMGAIDLKAQIGTLTNVADLKSKIWGLGADYNLSKRTSVYFRAESINDKSGSAVQGAVTPAAIKGTGTTFARTALGVRHAF